MGVETTRLSGWYRLGLRVQLALASSVLVALLAWGHSHLAGRHAAAELEQRIGAALVDTAQNLAELLDRAMWSRSGEVRVLASLSAFRELRVGGEVEEILATLQEALPVYTWVGLTDRDGVLLAATGNILVGADISARPVYQEGVQGFFVGDVHDAKLLASKLPNPSGEPIQFVDVAAAVRGADGEVVGVLAAHLSWTWAREVQRALFDPAAARRSAELMLVGADGSVLLGSEGVDQGQRPALAGLAQARAGEAHWRIERWADGDYLTGYALADGHMDYPGLGWVVVARQPLREAFAPAWRLQSYLLWAGLGMAALFAALAWALADRLVRPLQMLAGEADRLRRREVDELPELGGSVEVRRLSLVLRQMVRALTQRDAALGRMADLAHTDALTGLPNRLALAARLQRIGAAGGAGMAWLAIDLDGFKPINDTWGHAAGDVLLREVAARLRRCVRQDDLVARQGGDEFCALLQIRGDDPAAEALQVARRMLEAVQQPVEHGGAALKVGASIGIALWPQDGETPDEVGNHADRALYAAKARGRGCAVLWSVAASAALQQE